MFLIFPFERSVYITQSESLHRIKERLSKIMKDKSIEDYYMYRNYFCLAKYLDYKVLTALTKAVKGVKGWKNYLREVSLYDCPIFLLLVTIKGLNTRYKHLKGIV